MEYENPHSDRMGELHNSIVTLIDDAELTAPDVAIILRILANSIEKLFAASVMKRRIPPEKTESEE